MHVVVAMFYGASIWFSMLLYSLMSGERAWLVFLLGPVIVSGSMIVLWLLDALAQRLLEPPKLAK